MGFSVSEQTHDRLVFKRDKSLKQFSCAFILIALVFCGIGFLGFHYSPPGMSTQKIFFIVFGSVAFFLVFLGSIVPRLRGSFEPLSLVFDNSKGHVEVIQDKAASCVGYIRYDEIARFSIEEKKTSSNSSTSSTTSRSYYSFFVQLIKTDGGTWELVETGSQQYAQEVYAKLVAFVQLDKTPQPTPAIELSSKLQVDNFGSRSEVRWRNKVLRPLLLFLLVASVIAGVMCFFWFYVPKMMGGDMDAFFYIVMGFITFVFTLVIGIQGYKFIKDARTRYGVSIGHDTLVYFEESNSGVVRKKKEYTLEEIATIVYHFRLRQQDTDIYILRDSEANVHRSISTGDMSATLLRDLISTTLKEMRLSLTGLNCTEHLQLENWIQEQVKSRSRGAFTVL